MHFQVTGLRRTCDYFVLLRIRAGWGSLTLKRVSFGTATVLNIGRIVRSERGGSQEEVHAGLEGVEAAALNRIYLLRRSCLRAGRGCCISRALLSCLRYAFPVEPSKLRESTAGASRAGPMRPVCETSKWHCELHLRLNREASKRCRDKKKAPAGVHGSVTLAMVRAS
jgi:hypothetical protein